MNKTLKNSLIVLVSLILLTGSFAGGFITGHLLPVGRQLPILQGVSPIQPPVSVSPEQLTATPQDAQILFKPFWEAWNIIHREYVDQPVDDTKLMQGAINGMIQTLDVGRNYYLNPEQFDNQNAQLNGRDYEGIGAYVDVKGEYLTVISPIRNSPAEKAGLRSGDQFIAIDGKDMTGISPEDARQKVIGPEGTKVTLTILRKGVDHPFDVTITRAKINTPLVEYEMRPDGFAYIRLNSFGDTADQELRKAIEDALTKNSKGIIFDLRFNGGGYLDQGVAVTSEFLPKDKIVIYEKFGDGNQKSYTSLGNGAAVDIPMVVLVNEGSASASEIVAGALQDYGRAKLIGTRTYGKGSVQNVNVLEDNQGAVGVTVAQWLTPNQRLIEKIGLNPDIYVEISQADFDAGRDPQLDTAVQTLKAIINGTAIPTSMPTPAPNSTVVP